MQDLHVVRRIAAVALITLGASFWTNCSEQSPESVTGPDFQVSAGPNVAAAIQAQNRHTEALMHVPGVVGTAVGVMPNGEAGVRIFLEHAGVAGLPSVLEGIPVTVQVTGRFMAFSDPTTRQRPAPLRSLKSQAVHGMGTITGISTWILQPGWSNRSGTSNSTDHLR